MLLLSPVSCDSKTRSNVRDGLVRLGRENGINGFGEGSAYKGKGESNMNSTEWLALKF
jgi:hypothetical protein